jgi:hypothetical protein
VSPPSSFLLLAVAVITAYPSFEHLSIHSQTNGADFFGAVVVARGGTATKMDVVVFIKRKIVVKNKNGKKN